MAGDIHIHPTPEALFRDCADRITMLAQRSVEEHGGFHVALAGGTTPPALYRLLATPEFRSHIPWRRTHIYFGDERCVPPDHPDSNYRMAHETLLSQVSVPARQIHRMKGELPPEAAVREYTAELKTHAPEGGTTPALDLVLLGTGPDGHIASLFPGTDILKRRKPVAAVFVPKLDSWRISLTFPVINAARHIMILIAGEKKADLVRHIFLQDHHANPLPVEQLRPRGQLEWFLDRVAARHVLPTERKE